MNKIYYNLLFLFLLFVLVVNIFSSLISTNSKQMYNFFFYGERAIAITYFFKNVIVETGVKLKETPSEELINIADEASKRYNVDKTLLLLIIDPKQKYKFTETGGMGLTSIPVMKFLNSQYSDPFIPEDNIMAAAYNIRIMLDNGVETSDLIKNFYISENVKALAPNFYSHVIKLNNKYEDILSKNSANE